MSITRAPRSLPDPGWLAGAREPPEDPALDLTLDPAWVKGLPASRLPKLAAEIRRFLIHKVAQTGGHLGPNLGVVELTIALHRVFHSPRDVVLFDTGHQAYVHKILTGRAARFDTLRQPGGLSGYPSRAESPHDVIENSHASTALSYADGLAKALALRGERHRRIVAVVGDGALTGGPSWEALNNLGAAPARPVIIVLNDNGRSYAPTVGGVARHLADLRAGGSSARGPCLFETLGFAYVGPTDGHDVVGLEAAFHTAAELERPVVVHCVTQKGRGYLPAEHDDLDCLHTVGRIDSATGRAPVAVGAAEVATWTAVFADELAAIGAERDDVVCVTAAMADAVGLGPFAAGFPDRVFDVGIAEAHAVTSAAGLALGGLHPVVAIYATFLNRAFDQVVMDVALHRLPVTIVCDRAGITGPDGPSHHGVWDASVFPVVPGLRIGAPRDPDSLRALLREAVSVSEGPTLVRYPKAPIGPSVPAIARVGKLDVLSRFADAEVLLVGVGPLAIACVRAADELASAGVMATVVDPRWIAPIDPTLLELAAAHRLVLAVEDTMASGALGARIAQALAAAGSPACAATFALPPWFLPHAPRDGLLRTCGLEASGIATTVLKQLALLTKGGVR